MANAVNGLAHWLERKVGRGDKVETLAYMGIPDLRITILFLGAMKCGYKVKQYLLPCSSNHGQAYTVS